MIMYEDVSESSPTSNDESIESQELSFSVVNSCSEEQKTKFRLCERGLLKNTCLRLLFRTLTQVMDLDCLLAFCIISRK